MNPKILIQLGKVLSPLFLFSIPLVWIGLQYFDLLYINFLGFTLYTWLYIIAWYAVVFVMVIRPLADLFPKIKFLRQLCLLRRAFGILSAGIIVTFLIDKWIGNPQSFLSFFTPHDWDKGFTLAARLSELTALILLVTSNNFSQRKLGKNWKRVQRVSYIYFISGGILAMRYGDEYGVMISMILVGTLFFLAAGKKLWKKYKM